MQSCSHPGCVHLVICHRNRKMTSIHLSQCLLVWESSDQGQGYKTPFCRLCRFSGRDSSDFKPPGFLLLFSSCHPTQQIRIMTAFQICGACTVTQTVNGGTFDKERWNVLGRKKKKAIETNWPNKLIICSAFPGPQPPLLMKGSEVLPWRCQEFAKTHLTPANSKAKSLLPRLAAKSQCWQHSRRELSTAQKQQASADPL